MPVREPIKIVTKEDQLQLLGLKAAVYDKLRTDKEVIDTQMGEKKEAIKDDMLSNNLYEINGKHKEISIPLGDGKNKAFIQLQMAESVGYVDNIIQLLRDKLGAEADNYIMKQEVLHANALETMFNNGLITKEDLADMTVTKVSERFIVKIIDSTTEKPKKKK